MAATFMNNGLDPVDQQLLNKQASGDWKAHLFTNVVTPGVTDTTGTYTECVLSGYTSGGYTLTGSSWTGSTTAGVATYTYPSITITFASYGGGTTIYGYYITVTISATTYLVCAENYGSSYAVPAGGGQLILNFTETLQKH